MGARDLNDGIVELQLYIPLLPLFLLILDNSLPSMAAKRLVVAGGSGFLGSSNHHS